MKPILLLLPLFAMVLCGCPPMDKMHIAPDADYREPAIFSLKDSSYQFHHLNEALRGKRIVALGESSHGFGEVFQLKSDLVQYLHKNLGYTVLAMEGGYGDINLAWHQVDTLTALQLRDETLFGNFRSKEVAPLFDYLVENKDSDKRLAYVGFDSQTSSDYFYKTLDNYLRFQSPQFADSFKVHNNLYYQWYQRGMQQDSLGYEQIRQKYIELTDSALWVIGNVAKYKTVDQEEWDILFTTLDACAKAVDIPYEARYTAIGVRDSLMFENLKFLLEEKHPNEKFILWAHNAHIENASFLPYGYKWMGHYLKENYGNDYYSIGISVGSGEVYQHWTGNTMPLPEMDSTSLEGRLNRIENEITFIDLHVDNEDIYFLYDTLTAFEIENNGFIRYAPSKRFDGLIHLQESGAPSFD